MESAGLIRRTKLRPPAGSTVYELTELGEGLRPMMMELYRWGLQLLGPPTDSDHLRLSWALGAMQGRFRPEAARGVTESYELRVDDDVFHARIENGRLDLKAEAALDPDLVVQTDLATFVALASRKTTLDEAIANGRLELHGSKRTAERW